MKKHDLSNHNKSLEDITVRGNITAFGTYLSDVYLSAEEYANNSDIPTDLLTKGLGIQRKSVALPVQDTVVYVKNAVDDLKQKITQEQLEQVEFVEVGTESLLDGSLPLSNYIIEQLPSDDIISNESKHACIAAMNAIWKNLGDNGIVVAADIAEYDTNSAKSAVFTGGAGSVAIQLSQSNDDSILEILNVRGASTGLHYDFFKPYEVNQLQIKGSKAPVVFGSYSNLCNLEQTIKAYLNLKKRVNITLDNFEGFVFHTPYPGITKYNLAAIMHADRSNSNSAHRFAIDNIMVKISKAHEYFQNLISASDSQKLELFERIIKDIEKEIKNKYLKPLMDNPNFQRYYQLLEPSLRFISQTSNLYTASSPLCMNSLLENKTFKAKDHILWFGYGSGNQAIALIARTTENTQYVQKYNTQEKLDSRISLNYCDYEELHQTSHTPFEILSNDTTSSGVPVFPQTGFYLKEYLRYQIPVYEDANSIQEYDNNLQVFQDNSDTPRAHS